MALSHQEKAFLLPTLPVLPQDSCSSPSPTMTSSKDLKIVVPIAWAYDPESTGLGG